MALSSSSNVTEGLVAFGELGMGPGGRNVPAGIPPEKLPPIDAVLISHNHYDHLNLPSVKRVGAPVIAGLGMRELLAGEDITATELKWWQSVELGPVKVTFVPAQHWSRPVRLLLIPSQCGYSMDSNILSGLIRAI